MYVINYSSNFANNFLNSSYPTRRTGPPRPLIKLTDIPLYKPRNPSSRKTSLKACLAVVYFTSFCAPALPNIGSLRD